jgi:hypothetical protein
MPPERIEPRRGLTEPLADAPMNRAVSSKENTGQRTVETENDGVLDGHRGQALPREDVAADPGRSKRTTTRSRGAALRRRGCGR